MNYPSVLFLQASSKHLVEYLDRIKKAVENLTHEQIWWKPHASTTSIGILLSHLNGNITQWIISGLGGEPDDRNRSAEFDPRQMPEKEILLKRFSETISKACAVIEAITDKDLATTICIQDFETNKLEAIYHVVEHCSWHSGQITWIAKMLQGESHTISFYDNDKLNIARNR